MNSKNREDYLRAIFCLGEQGDDIKSIDIANYLKISKAAVSSMLKKLKAEGYIEMLPYSNISFTKKGEREAKKITSKHRLAETFLKKVLRFNGDLDTEAHKLEHALSDDVAGKLAEFMGYPLFCPCGDKIHETFKR